MAKIEKMHFQLLMGSRKMNSRIRRRDNTERHISSENARKGLLRSPYNTKGDAEKKLNSLNGRIRKDVRKGKKDIQMDSQNFKKKEALEKGKSSKRRTKK